MKEIIFWAILYCITTSASILLLGSPKLLTGEKINLPKIIEFVFTVEFIAGAALAFFSRLIFILINNLVSKIPALAPASTTVTVFITLTSTITIVLANHLFLGDRLTTKQIIGFVIILTGVFLATS